MSTYGTSYGGMPTYEQAAIAPAAPPPTMMRVTTTEGPSTVKGNGFISMLVKVLGLAGIGTLIYMAVQNQRATQAAIAKLQEENKSRDETETRLRIQRINADAASRMRDILSGKTAVYITDKKSYIILDPHGPKVYSEPNKSRTELQDLRGRFYLVPYSVGDVVGYSIESATYASSDANKQQRIHPMEQPRLTCSPDGKVSANYFRDTWEMWKIEPVMTSPGDFKIISAHDTGLTISAETGEVIAIDRNASSNFTFVE